jgi:hypothetical protein
MKKPMPTSILLNFGPEQRQQGSPHIHFSSAMVDRSGVAVESKHEIAQLQRMVGQGELYRDGARLVFETAAHDKLIVHPQRDFEHLEINELCPAGERRQAFVAIAPDGIQFRSVVGRGAQPAAVAVDTNSQPAAAAPATPSAVATLTLRDARKLAHINKTVLGEFEVDADGDVIVIRSTSEVLAERLKGLFDQADVEVAAFWIHDGRETRAWLTTPDADNTIKLECSRKSLLEAVAGECGSGRRRYRASHVADGVTLNPVQLSPAEARLAAMSPADLAFEAARAGVTWLTGMLPHEVIAAILASD